jgi:hypothetical protein
MAAIVPTDIAWRYSVTTGTAGNTTAGTALGSLGRYISTTAWAGGAANDLFDDLSAATGIALGTIASGSVRAFWVRRTAANTAALSGDGMSLTCSGDTGSL